MGTEVITPGGTPGPAGSAGVPGPPGIDGQDGEDRFLGVPITIPDRLRSNFDPSSMLFEYDDFGVGGSGTTNQIGKLGWEMAGGTVALIAGVINHPGIIEMSSTNVANTPHRLAWRLVLGQVDPGMLFDMMSILLPVGVTTNFIIRTGLAATWSVNPPTNGIYFESDPVGGNWFRVTKVDASVTRIDTTFALAAWVKLRVRRIDATNIGFTVYPNAEQLNTTNIPVVVLSPGFQLVPQIAVIQKLDVDYSDLLITGMTR